MTCGLCHGLGRFSEYGETWPCPACNPEPEERTMITESLKSTIDPEYGRGYFLTEDVMRQLVNLEGKAHDALDALRASDNPPQQTQEAFQRSTRIQAINFLKNGLEAI